MLGCVAATLCLAGRIQLSVFNGSGFKNSALVSQYGVQLLAVEGGSLVKKSFLHSWHQFLRNTSKSTLPFLGLCWYYGAIQI